MIPLRPTAQTSQSHAPTHATGGTDPLTPAAIGAAAATHTHTGSQISGNISGNAANVTGVVAIANGGTGAVNAAAALTNLGAAPTSHTHTGSQISGNISGNAANVTGVVAIANGGTGSDSVAGARTNLQIGMNEISYTLNSGWVNFNANFGLSIHKFSNLIIISGIVRREFGTNNTILALPNSCWPKRGVAICSMARWNDARYFCRILLYLSGDLVLEGGGGTPEVNPLIVPSVIDSLYINATFVTANP